MEFKELLHNTKILKLTQAEVHVRVNELKNCEVLKCLISGKVPVYSTHF